MTGLKFSSRDFLRLLESHGVSGAWSWIRGDSKLVWSPGFFRLIGLEPHSVQADYGLFVSLVHPDDRPSMPSTADLHIGAVVRDQTFRVIQPDGFTRVLAGRTEVSLSSTGTVQAVSGTVLDVSDRERLLGLRALESRRWNLLSREFAIFPFTMTADLVFHFQPDAAPPWMCLQQNAAAAFSTMVHDADRDAYLEALSAHIRQVKTFEMMVRAEPRHKDWKWMRVSMTPMRDTAADVGQWSGVLSFMQRPVAMPTNPEITVSNHVRGRHIRAARALLDWSMDALAGASGLSLSTVRRVEEGHDLQVGRSRMLVLEALRQNRVHFSMTASGDVAVSCA